MTRPVAETILATLAGSLVGVLLLVPLGPWLAPTLYPLALSLSMVWLGWRLLVLDHVLTSRRAWRHNTSWVLTPETLAQEEYRR